ncbi:hypothetical protein ACYSUW_14715 [Pseudomonas frederiksbergensis]
MPVSVESLKAVVRRIPLIGSKKFLKTLVAVIVAIWVVEKFRPHTGSLEDMWFTAFFGFLNSLGMMYLCLAYLVWDFGKKDSVGKVDSGPNDKAD